MISLTADEATNLNRLLGVISLQTQSDEIPAFHLDDRNGLIAIFKLNNFEEHLDDDLADIGLTSTVEEDYLIIEI